MGDPAAPNGSCSARRAVHRLVRVEKRQSNDSYHLQDQRWLFESDRAQNENSSPTPGLNRVYYADARQPQTLWEIPHGGHTGAPGRPRPTRQHVVAFFDRPLLAR
jgi:hypothetical protein